MLTALLSLAVAPLAAPVELKMTFAEGQTYAFLQKDETNVELVMMGEETKSELKGETKVTYTFTNIRPDGTADFTIIGETLKMEAVTDGESADDEELPGKTTTTGKIDAWGVMTGVKTETEGEESEEEEGEDPFSTLIENAFSDAMPRFPKTPVSVGDRWTSPLEEKKMMFREGAVLNFLLKESETVDGKSLVRIDSSAEEKLNINFAEMMDDPDMADMKGSGDMKMNNRYWVLPNGHMHKYEIDLDMEFSIALMGMDLRMKVSSKSTAQRAE